MSVCAPLPAPKHRLRRGLILVLAIYAAWIGALYTQQTRLIFPRQFSGPPLKEGRLPPRIETIWINAGTQDKPIRVEAWYLPAPEASQDHKVPVVIYCHGNAELIDDNMERAQQWNARGFAVLIPEYRGYGRSGGTPSQANITADLTRFYDMVASKPEINRDCIVVHGRSLGGGVAAQLAALRPTAGLVLESTFTSVACMAWQYGAPSFICSSPFRTDAALQNYAQPVLIFHGSQDDIIPASHGRALHRAIATSTYVETAGDHINYPPDPAAFWRDIDAFVARVAPKFNRSP